MPTVKDAGIARPYPALPADQVTACKRANVEGQLPRIAWRRAEAAFDACEARRVRLVRWYERLRATRTAP